MTRRGRFFTRWGAAARNGAPTGPAIAMVVVVLAIAASPSILSAAELVVLCSNGLKAVLSDAGPQFEQATGHRLAISYGVSSALKRRIDAGERFDVAVLTPPAIDPLIARGVVDATTRAAVARSPIAIAVRRGAPKPDLATVDALRTALASARSIAFAREGAGGIFFAALLTRLGLAGDLGSKLRPLATGEEVSRAVASGDAELGVQPLSEIVSTPGVEAAGGFPPPFQEYTVMTAGAAGGSKHIGAARALIAFLTSSAVDALLAAKGMERVP